MTNHMTSRHFTCAANGFLKTCTKFIVLFCTLKCVFLCLSGGRSTRRDPRFQPLGCFRDRPRRALPLLIYRTRGFNKGFWLVNKCGRIALSKRFKMFSVQYHLECWSGRSAHRTYGRYGRRGGCSYWTGGTWANDVYRIKGGKHYK